MTPATALPGRPTMRALRKVAPGAGGMAVVDVRPPAVAPDEALLEVEAAGVCGTDLHVEAGEYEVAVPVTLGHEICGRVAAVGRDVEPSWRGARVVTETFYSTCGACPWCTAGRPNLCRARRSIGTHVDGGFAELVVVPSANLHPIPDTLPSVAAALLEPLACVCRSLLEPPVPARRALVVGPGPIGILAAQVLRASGGDVVLAGTAADASRLALAESLGLSTAPAASVDSEFEVVVEASGSEGGARRCLDAACAAGTYVQIGLFGRPVTLDLDRVVFKELTVRAGFASRPSSWRLAIELVEGGEVDLQPLVSRVAALSEWPSVFDDLRERRALKVVFDPRRA